MTIWAYDIECESWDRFVVGAAVSEHGDVRTFDFHDESETIDWYCSLPKSDEVIAHNGGAYDFLQLIAAGPHLTWRGALAGSSIVTCRAKGHALCRDSYRLFPLSLAKWTNRKSETGLICVCGEKCGGYCSIRRSMPRAARQRLRDYCVNDCRALIDTWIEDTERLAADGLDVVTSRGTLRTTIGGVAWNTGATMAGIDTRHELDWGDYDAGRRAYYGGRVEVGRVTAPRGRRYDVHAMYPWALTHDVPHGRRRALYGRDATRAYARDELGLFHARVHVPDTDLPPLPHRYHGETQERLVEGRLIWATGYIEGDWSGIELRHAEEHGVKIHKIEHADTWSHASPLFKPYVEHVYAMRRKAIDAGDERWGSVLKWFANSLSGKLAQKAEISNLMVIGPDADPLEGWEQHGGPDSRVYSQTIAKVPTSGHTWAAATLTARSRVKLHERLARHSGRWLYCDTDSTYLIDEDNTGVHKSKLGSWGYEGEAIDWLALAPKLYRYRDEEGTPHVRARGVPRATWEALDKLRAGETVTAEGGVLRIRTSEGRFVARSVKRTHHDAGTDRCGTRYVLRDGTTRALHRDVAGRYV